MGRRVNKFKLIKINNNTFLPSKCISQIQVKAEIKKKASVLSISMTLLQSKNTHLLGIY